MTAASQPARCQELECPPGHCDLAESLGNDQRQPGIFRTSRRDTQVITQKIAQVLVVDSAGDDCGNPRRHGAGQRLGRHPSPADHDAAVHFRRDRFGRQVLVGLPARHRDRAEGFPADSEYPLNQRSLGLDRRPFVFHHFDDSSRQKGMHLDWQRIAAQHHLSGHARDRFDDSRRRRRTFLFHPAEDPLRAGQKLSGGDGVSLIHEHRPRQVAGWDGEQIGDVDWRNRPRQMRLRDDIAGGHLVAGANENLAWNRQDSPPAQQHPRGHLQSRRISLGHVGKPEYTGFV